MPARFAHLPVLCTLALGCREPAASDGSAAGRAAEDSCPARARAPDRLPGTEAKHRTLDYWLGRYSSAALDETLLSTEDVAAYNVALGRSGTGVYSQRNLLAPVDPAELAHELRERVGYLRARLEDGRYVRSQGKAAGPNLLAPFATALPEALTPTLRVALALIPMRCGPLDEALLESKNDQNRSQHLLAAPFGRDSFVRRVARPQNTGGFPAVARPAPERVERRNPLARGIEIGSKPPENTYDRNACSSVRPQEVVQILAPWPGGMLLARTRYTFGFIPSAAALSPPIPATQAEAFVAGARARVEKTALELALAGGGRAALTKHTTLPLAADGSVLVATRNGFERASGSGLSPVRRPLTRRALLTTAFQFLDSPYGFGDAQGGRDCSRLTLDLFETFNLALPRHSGWQAQAGTLGLVMTGLGTQQKLAAIERAAKRGAVLLHLPGHVMLYLGENDAGAPMALHALGEYVKPCARGSGETVLDLQRTVVSDLELGRGSSRGSLLERLTSLTVLGAASATALEGAQARTLPPRAPRDPEGECRDSVEARIFVSPARPLVNKPFRLIGTTSKPAMAASLFVYAAGGRLLQSASRRLGGPPWSGIASLEGVPSGRYTALLRDGEVTLGCKRITVHDGPLAAEPAAGGPVWTPRWSWERDTLNLWSAFVEQLFDDPPDDERTWTNLHELLRDRRRNLLYDHLGLGEDDRLELVPDCADLPYALRAYFSWKLQLPFAYRQCARGRTGVPPTCGSPQTNLMPRESEDPVEAFGLFVNRKVRSGAHSATGRTHPEDSETDLYPVAFERASLPPGTVYADPYGHVMLLTKWFAQGSAPDAYGILIAAEAQPDNTLGRRRFFRGSFLFDPSTRDVGAGFKQFRPLVYDRVAQALTPLDNASLADSRDFAPFSLEQYRGTQDVFYDRMDRLINPAPLDAGTRLTSLLDALEEAARRRVLAVDNGEQYMRANPRTVPMPSGHDIFETVGPWEDYATPSRDMRLLIALDTVLALPGQVQQDPARFKLADAGAGKRTSHELRSQLDRELARRTFSYTKSDGSVQALALRDVIDRKAALEVAYNPNDCVELRWGAPEGSEERKSCLRRAPPEQRERMDRYRTWFHTRTRPARGTGE